MCFCQSQDVLNQKSLQLCDLPCSLSSVEGIMWEELKMKQQHLVKGCLKFTEWEDYSHDNLHANVPLVHQKLVKEFSIHFTRLCPSVHHVFVLKQSFSSFLAGIRSWDIDLKCCNLDQQLQLFITRHSAHFEVRGQCDVALFDPMNHG